MLSSRPTAANTIKLKPKLSLSSVSENIVVLIALKRAITSVQNTTTRARIELCCISIPYAEVKTSMGDTSKN